MKKILENVQGFYNTNADYFSHTRKYIWPELLPYLKKLKPTDKVLDVGCGNGRLLSAFKHSSYMYQNYTGVDFSKGLIDIAKKLHPNDQFLNLDITNQKSWTKLGHFDAIFCIAVLHHLPSKREHQFVVNQIKKHLKPGGFAVISVWNLWQLKYLRHHLRVDSLKLKLSNWRHLYVPFQESHKRFCYAFTRDELVHLVKSSNWEINDIGLGKNLLVTAS